MFNIAIDGPAGAGKSSIAREVASRLGFIYVDTGALYRAVAVFVLNNGLDTDDAEAIENKLPEAHIGIQFTKGEQRVILNGTDVSEEIRMPNVSAVASKTSAIPAVRKFLFELQQNLAKKTNCIMDGRDIGTVVLPNADLKIFLTASAEERAMRRYKQLKENGTDVTYEEILDDQKQRDYQDTHREISPLKAADDAVVLDTTGVPFDGVADKIEELAKERLK